MFVEPPYTFHGPYVFYKSFTYKTPTRDKDEIIQESPPQKSLCIGDYFFIRVPVKGKDQLEPEKMHVCLLAQLQLLWINRDGPKIEGSELNNGSSLKVSEERNESPSPKISVASVVVGDSEESSCCDVMLPSSLTGPTSPKNLTELKKPTRGRPKKSDESNELEHNENNNNYNGSCKKAWLKVLNLPQNTHNRYANIKIFLSPGHLVDLLSNPGIAYRYGEDEVVQLETSVSLSFKELMDGITDYNEHFASKLLTLPINPYINGWRRDGKTDLTPNARCCVLTYPAYLRYRAGIKKSHEMTKLLEYPENQSSEQSETTNKISKEFAEEFAGKKVEKVKEGIQFLFCKTTFGDNSQNLTRSLFSTCTPAPIFRGRPNKDKDLSKSRFRLTSLLSAQRSSLSTTAHMKLLKGLTNSYKAKLGYGLVKKRYDAWKCYMRRPQELATEDLPTEENFGVSNDSPFQPESQDELTMDCQDFSPTLMQKSSLFPPSTEPDTNGEAQNLDLKIPIVSGENGDNAREQFFIELRTFMSQRGTPIKKIPYLGFRPIDLYLFYKLVQTMGGYREVRFKRMWKRLYDHMGGCPNNTSAATCTRKHYENLLLPFEIWENRRQKSNASLTPTNGSASPQQLDQGPDLLSRDRDQHGALGSSQRENENAIDKLFSLIMASKKDKNKVNSIKPRPSPPSNNGLPTRSEGDPGKRKRGRPRLSEEEKRLRSTRLPYGTLRFNQQQLMALSNRENDLGAMGGPNGLIIRKPKVFQSLPDRSDNRPDGPPSFDETCPRPNGETLLQRMSNAPYPFPPFPPFHGGDATSDPDYSLASYMQCPPAGMFPNFPPSFNPFEYGPRGYTSSARWPGKKKRGRPSTKSLCHTPSTLIPSLGSANQDSNEKNDRLLDPPTDLTTGPPLTTSLDGASGPLGENVKRKRGRPPKTAEEKAATALSRKQHLAQLKASSSSHSLFNPPFDPTLYSSLFPFIPNFHQNSYQDPRALPSQVSPAGPGHNGTSETSPTISPLDNGQQKAVREIPQTGTEPDQPPNINYSPIRQLKNPSLRRKGKIPLRITRNPIVNDAEMEITDSVPIITNGWAGTRSILPRPNLEPEPKANGVAGSGGGYDNPLDEYKRVMEEHYKSFMALSQGQKDKNSPFDLTPTS